MKEYALPVFVRFLFGKEYMIPLSQIPIKHARGKNHAIAFSTSMDCGASVCGKSIKGIS